MSGVIKGSVSDTGLLKGSIGAMLGKDGYSAYEVAVKNGFDGTEEEWLASLKGDKGDKGDPFVYEDFTPEQLASIKGEKGDVGNPGVYIGSGDMPNDYNVQIDPNGDALDGSDLAKASDVNQLSRDIADEKKRAVKKENEIEALFTLPTQEAVNSWLNAHPEATTTVQDKSLTIDKMVLGTLGYITPEMFGAVGDGVTDDSAALQACFDYACENQIPVEFRTATYKCYGLTLGAGVRLHGNGAVLKKPNLSAAPYNMTVADMKWIRTITLSYTGAQDSKMTVLKDLEFDGNCWEMWSTEDGYAQEQASLLIAYGSASAPGRLNLTIENCYFHDSTSDGIHIRTNANATILNCRSRDCFRGGITLTGGNTTVTVNGFDSVADLTCDGIDIEPDGAGYGDSYAVDVRLNNVYIDKDLDVAISRGSRFTAENLYMRKGGYYIGVGADVTLRNVYLKKDDSISAVMGELANLVRIYETNTALFENVIFDGNGCTNSACQTRFYSIKSSFVHFDKCKFINGAWGIGGSGTANDATFVVTNCVFETTNGYGGKDGNVEMSVPTSILENNIFNVESIAIQSISGTGYASKVLKLRGNTMKTCTYALKLYRNILIMQDETWTAGLAISKAGGHSATNHYGKRMNIVSADPNGTAGIGGVNFEDYASDGTTKWKYKSGTTWEVVTA